MKLFSFGLQAYSNKDLPQNGRNAIVPVPSGIGTVAQCGIYRVTAYNPQGDSYIPQVITVCPQYCLPDNNLSNDSLQINNQ